MNDALAIAVAVSVAIIAVVEATMKEGRGRKVIIVSLVTVAMLASIGSIVLQRREDAEQKSEDAEQKKAIDSLTAMNVDLQKQVKSLEGANVDLKERVKELQATSADVQQRTRGLQSANVVPRVTVSTDAPVDPKNPLLVPLVFTNEGNVALKNFRFSCVFESVTFANKLTIEQVVVTFVEPPVARVEPGERATRFCEPQQTVAQVFPVATVPVEHADLSLFVTFRTDTGPYEKRFRLVTVPGTPLRWTAQPWAQRH